MEEVIDHINSLIKKYGSQPQYLEMLKKHCLENLETIVIEKVAEVCDQAKHRETCQEYVSIFCDKYLESYWYHHFTGCFYMESKHRLIEIPEDYFQPLVSDLLKPEHQPHRVEILTIIKDRIKKKKITESFIPSESMIQKVKNLFQDTFADQNQTEYFLWFIGRVINECIQVDKENNSFMEIMIWIGSQNDIWIEWLKQSIHDHFRRFPTLLSEIKQSFHTSYSLSRVRVLSFLTNGYTLRSKCVSDNDVFLFLLVGYHYYKRTQFTLDIERHPHIFFLSQFQSRIDIFEYIAKQCIDYESQQSETLSGCYLYEVIEEFFKFLIKSRLPQNLLTKKEISYRMEQFYPNHRKTKQWYQGLVLSKVVKSRYVEDFLTTDIVEFPDKSNYNNYQQEVVPVTIEQLLYYYHQWRVLPPVKKNSDLPKKEFVRYLLKKYPDFVVREETAFLVRVKNFSVPQIVFQYLDQEKNYSYHSFQQWYSEVYSEMEMITAWQFRMAYSRINKSSSPITNPSQSNLLVSSQITIPDEASLSSFSSEDMLELSSPLSLDSNGVDEVEDDVDDNTED